jgi:hypothetical protein
LRQIAVGQRGGRRGQLFDVQLQMLVGHRISGRTRAEGPPSCPKKRPNPRGVRDRSGLSSTGGPAEVEPRAEPLRDRQSRR